jgi:tight adherence protein B
VIVLAALGLALLLQPAADPTLNRLRWLAGTRLPRPGPSGPAAAGRPRQHASRRAWTVLTRLPWQARAASVAAATAITLACCRTAPLLVGAAGLGGWTLCWCWQLLAVEHTADRDRVVLAAAVGALAEEYAAGAGLGAALRSAAPAAGRFGTALVEAAVLADFGAEPQQALGREPLLAPLAVACALAARSGASITSLLAGVRADLAADRATRSAVHAAVAGPRSSALLLAGLPAIGLGMGAAMGADPARVLLRTPAGSVVLTAGVLLDLLGLVWTLLLTRQAR